MLDILKIRKGMNKEIIKQELSLLEEKGCLENSENEETRRIIVDNIVNNIINRVDIYSISKLNDNEKIMLEELCTLDKAMCDNFVIHNLEKNKLMALRGEFISYLGVYRTLDLYLVDDYVLRNKMLSALYDILYDMMFPVIYILVRWSK